jgi:DNA repair protein RecO (recombination protein O)
MSTVIKTDAVVLRSMDYRETSKIITLYTRQSGRMGVMVKGARQRKNTFGSTLEPLSYIAAVIYTKEGRDLQLLTECDHRRVFRSIPASLEKMTVGLAVLEIMNLVTHDGQDNNPLFDLLVETLTVLDGPIANPDLLLAYFEIALAVVLGFRPALGVCVECGKEIPQLTADEEYAFDLSRGGLLCRSCANPRTADARLSPETVDLLRLFLHHPPAMLTGLGEISLQTTAAVKKFTWMFLRYHVHGLRTLKSEKVFSAIQQIF